ncbi:MAG: VOC family protein [Thermoplasmata archaeon]
MDARTSTALRGGDRPVLAAVDPCRNRDRGGRRDAHCERAKRQGAAVLSAPKDQPWGVRSYAALDPEGHQWEFASVTHRSHGESGGGGGDDRA